MNKRINYNRRPASVDELVIKHMDLIDIVKVELKKGATISDISRDFQLPRNTIYRLIRRGIINYEYKHKNKRENVV